MRRACVAWDAPKPSLHPEQDAARRVAELEADQRVLLTQLDLQAHSLATATATNRELAAAAAAAAAMAEHCTRFEVRLSEAEGRAAAAMADAEEAREALRARAPLDAELFARTSAAEARAEATERMLAAANAKAASAEARAAEAQRFIDSFINS